MHLVAETRNKAIVATTLHTMMNIHVQCMQRGCHLEIHFVDDKASLPKMIKSGERIFWMEYGTNLNNEILPKIFEPMPKGTSVIVFPSVKEGINWEQFAQKTRAGSTEPSNQRGLTFDTEVGKKLADGIYECTKTSARVWLMDAKMVDKKLRGEKVAVRLDTSSYAAMFEQLLRMNVKIAAATNSQVICHFVHECSGNILETQGVRVGK